MNIYATGPLTPFQLIKRQSQNQSAQNGLGTLFEQKLITNNSGMKTDNIGQEAAAPRVFNRKTDASPLGLPELQESFLAKRLASTGSSESKFNNSNTESKRQASKTEMLVDFSTQPEYRISPPDLGEVVVYSGSSESKSNNSYSESNRPDSKTEPLVDFSTHPEYRISPPSLGKVVI